MYTCMGDRRRSYVTGSALGCVHFIRVSIDPHLVALTFHVITKSAARPYVPLQIYSVLFFYHHFSCHLSSSEHASPCCFWLPDDLNMAAGRIHSGYLYPSNIDRPCEIDRSSSIRRWIDLLHGTHSSPSIDRSASLSTAGLAFIDRPWKPADRRTERDDDIYGL